MITVHPLENSRSQRVLWLLEELELDYEIRHYKRNPGAIIEYLIDRYGNGRLKPPAGSQAHLDYTYWLHYAEGSLMPLLVMKLVFSRIPKSPMPFFVKPVAKGIAGKAGRQWITRCYRRWVPAQRW